MNKVKHQANRCLKISARLVFACIVAVGSTRNGLAQIRYSRLSHQRERIFYKRVYLLGGVEIIGAPYNYKFQQRGMVLQKGWQYPDGYAASGNGLAVDLSLHYRYSKSNSMEIGYHFQGIPLLLHDQKFITHSGLKVNDFGNRDLSVPVAENGNFAFISNYNSYYFSLFHFFPSQRRSSFYVSSGLTFNTLSDNQYLQASFSNIPTNENLLMSVHYKPFYMGGFVEAGLHLHPSHVKHPNREGPVYFIGLKYYYAGEIISADYQDTKNGTPLYTDHASSGGSYMSLSVKIGGGVWHNQRKSTKRFHKPKKIRSTPQKNQVPLKKDQSNTRGF